MRSWLALLLVGCVGSDPGLDELDAAPTDEADAAPDAGVDAGPRFIGSPCDDSAACDYSGGVCLESGFPDGLCSQVCDGLCPDADGFPVTFCVDVAELPPVPGDFTSGACVSQCDLGLYPDGGCRPGYGCVAVPRANEAGTLRYACLPGATSELSACQLELAARGLHVVPTVVADAHPTTNPELTCHIEDPIYLYSPVEGVALADASGAATTRLLLACNAARALADTAVDVAAAGAVEIRQMGTYNCRVIAGTSTLSRHAYADAIDFAGFRLADDTVYTVVDDWEHGTSSPTTPGGQFLYAAAHRWYAASVWNIILTPEYNAAHDNHFHVDMTPGSHYLGFLPLRGGPPLGD